MDEQVKVGDVVWWWPDCRGLSNDDDIHGVGVVHSVDIGMVVGVVYFRQGKVVSSAPARYVSPRQLQAVPTDEAERYWEARWSS